MSFLNDKQQTLEPETCCYRINGSIKAELHGILPNKCDILPRGTDYLFLQNSSGLTSPNAVLTENTQEKNILELCYLQQYLSERNKPTRF